MSPKVVFEQWVSQHAIRFIAYAIAVGIAWGGLTAAVGGKADKQEVSHVNAKMDSVARKVDAVMYLLCRHPDNRHDSACK